MGGYEMSGDDEQRSSKTRGIILAIIGGAVIIAIALAIGLAIGLRSQESSCPDDSEEVNTRAPPGSEKSRSGKYRFAAVASDSEKCSQIGTEIMGRHQGNAVDAAVATVLCGGVLNGHSSGIGGGSFIVVYNRTTRQATTFNARETAPGFATEDMYVNDPSQSVIGGKAVGVPGELKGLWEIHQRYGRVPWATLLQPTIDLCEKGAPLSYSMYSSTSRQRVMDRIMNNPEFSFLYDNSTGTPVPYPMGHIIYRPNLAQTLRVIATEGISAFYNGSLTQDVIDDIKDGGGNITREDLLHYLVGAEAASTLNLESHNLTLHSMPPPGSGLVMEYILNILSGYNLSPESVSTTSKSILTFHRIVEAMKFAFAIRSQLGDKDFVNITELMANMTSPEVGEMIRSKIDDVRTHDTSYYGPKFDITKTPGTAHFSVMDGEGNAVAITSTVNIHFGSSVKGSRTGIIFNNQMDDFSTPNTTNFYGVPASPANFIAPGKRPLSSMSPTVVVDGSGNVQLVVGGAGGTKITTAVSLMVIRTLWFKESLPFAVDAPRIHHQLLPKMAFVQNDFPQDILDGLKAKGHDYTADYLVKSVITAIRRTSDSHLEAVSDAYEKGAPDGF
ncbi:hypothetical protein ACOMHN_052445 [Nucella lapillus]